MNEPVPFKPITDSTIREIFLHNGFTIKEGQTDLKPYVYTAARELIATVHGSRDERKPLTRGLLIDLWAENIRDGVPDAVAFARAIEKAHGVRSDTDAIDALPQPAVPSGWVDVYKRLPPEGVPVLATGIEYGYSSGKRWTEIGQRCTDGSWLTQDGHDELYRPTHWMPLPAAPDPGVIDDRAWPFREPL